MSSNNNASQQVKGVVDSTRIRDGSSVINNGSNESQIIHQKNDDQILLTSLQQQQQQQFYHPHHQGAPAAHQQYTMYPSGVTYSIDPTQAGTNPAGLDYTMIQPQQIYQVPVYFSSETYHPQHGYEDPYQTSSSTQFQTAAAVGGVGGQAAAVPSQYHHHIQTAQYSGGGGEHHLQPQHHHPQQQTYMQQENNSQGIYPKPNATMFDNTAAKYTADWVSRTTLIPSEMKVPPDQAVDLVSHDSKVITPKNWGEGSYVVTTSSTSKPIASATVDQQQPLLDQQLAQLDITSFPFVSSQLSQPQQQQGVLGGGYAMNWPGTSQQQPQQQQIYRDQRAYNATGGAPKPQATSWADITRKGTNNNNNNIVYQQQQQQQQQRPQFGGNANFQDQRGTQSAQPTGQSQIRHERSFTGPKNTFNQTGANNPGSFVRNVHRSSGNFGNNRGAGNNMSRGNNRSGGPPRQPQHNPSYSAPPQHFQPQQQRGPIPSLLAQHRTQNFPRNNFGGQQQRPQGNNTFGFPPFGGGPNQHQQSHQQQQHHQQQMPEFNPGVPPPALPNQFRQPIPPMMPPFPPPPFNMMNPQQQQQFFRAFISQVRPDAMMPPGPYGFDQFGQRFFNPGYPFGHHPGAGGGPPFGQQFNNRFPNFNRGQRRGRGGGRFQQPRRNFQDQSRYNNSNTQQSQQQQQSSPQNSANPKQLDPELADSVNRGVEFDRDETKTPEPKGDTETTGSPNEDKKDSPKDNDDADDDKDTSSSSSSSSSSSPTNANPTTTKTAETTTT